MLAIEVVDSHVLEVDLAGARFTIDSFLPEGVVQLPVSERYDVHPELKVGIGRHPQGTLEQRQELTNLIQEFQGIIAYSMEDLREGYKGKAGGLKIKQIDPTQHAFRKPIRHGKLKEMIADKHFEELERVGIIEPAPHCRHACNVTFAQKRGEDGNFTDIRVCINYAPQNDLSEPQHTHFPIADQLFQEIGDCKWMSKIDLRSGFMQVPVEEGSRDCTGFWWGSNLYRFKRMPFGMKQCPSAYQYVMDYEIGQAGLGYCCKVFVDDILVHSPTYEQHLIDLRKLFKCLLDCGLRIHPGKSMFGTSSMEFLGLLGSTYHLTGSLPSRRKLKPCSRCPTRRALMSCVLRWASCDTTPASVKISPRGPGTLWTSQRKTPLGAGSLRCTVRRSTIYVKKSLSQVRHCDCMTRIVPLLCTRTSVTKG